MAAEASPVEIAPAKINLTLRVRGRRADSYHLLESLVVFADVGDHLTLTPGPEMALDVAGATAEAAGPVADNLVLKAARRLADAVPGLRGGRFHLDKRLPVAAGIGGGSSDAAAALRLLARLNGLDLDDPRLMLAARGTGADVPVCLDPRPRMMRGIGEILSAPLPLPSLPGVLVNPGVALATKDVFGILALPPGTAAPAPDPTYENLAARGGVDEFRVALMADGNDLEPPALRLQPVVATVLERLRAQPDCTLARMSGSGATCFGLFGSDVAAHAAAAAIKAVAPSWWSVPVRLG